MRIDSVDQRMIIGQDFGVTNQKDMADSFEMSFKGDTSLPTPADAERTTGIQQSTDEQ